MDAGDIAAGGVDAEEVDGTVVVAGDIGTGVAAEGVVVSGAG
jgi:hypothetical protein